MFDHQQSLYLNAQRSLDEKRPSFERADSQDPSSRILNRRGFACHLVLDSQWVGSCVWVSLVLTFLMPRYVKSLAETLASKCAVMLSYLPRQFEQGPFDGGVIGGMIKYSTRLSSCLWSWETSECEGRRREAALVAFWRERMFTPQRRSPH